MRIPWYFIKRLKYINNLYPRKMISEKTNKVILPEVLPTTTKNNHKIL